MCEQEATSGDPATAGQLPPTFTLPVCNNPLAPDVALSDVECKIGAVTVVAGSGIPFGLSIIACSCHDAQTGHNAQGVQLAVTVQVRASSSCTCGARELTCVIRLLSPDLQLLFPSAM